MNSKKITLNLIICVMLMSLMILAANARLAAQSETVLYDNGNIPTGNRAENGQLVCCGLIAWSELQHDAGNMAEANKSRGFDGNKGRARLADDFIIRAGNTWTITSVTFFTYAFDFGPPSPVTEYSLRIWNGRPGDPGSMVIFGDDDTNRLTGCEFTHMSRIANTVVPPPGQPTGSGISGIITKCTVGVSPALTLGPGTYWLDWDSKYIITDPEEDIFGHGDPTATILGMRGYAYWNARRFDVATGQWSDVVDQGVPLTAPDVPQDFPFKINGTLIAPGGLDPTLDVDGKVTTPIGSGNDQAQAVAIQSDGKIVTAGFSQNTTSVETALVRYNADGSLDTSFGGDGKVTTPYGSHSRAYAVAIQSDGKIVAAGDSGSPGAVFRYNADGTLDTTFDGDGVALIGFDTNNTNALLYAVAIQPDNKIVVAGYYEGLFSAPNNHTNDFALARLNPDGSLDTSFGTNGKVLTNIGGGDTANALIIQPDGKIVAAGVLAGFNGSAFALVRYNTNGSLDTSFDGDGKVLTGFGGEDTGGSANAVALDPSGKIVAAGGYASETDRGFAIVRYNIDGSLDLSFDSDGIVKTPFAAESAYGIGIGRNGRIVAAGGSGSLFGSNFDFVVVRYNADGSLDPSFDMDGKVMTDFFSHNDVAEAVSIQSDGRIVAAGYASNGTNYDFAVARYIADAAVWHGPLFDFDGDGRTDISVFRPSTAAWYLNQSEAGPFGIQFGVSTDKIVPADYDRDGKTDIAVYRPSEGIWYIINSSNNTFSYRTYGLANDLPAPGDYDGDGRADLSVFRPSDGTWYRQNSFDGQFAAIQWGQSGDVPMHGDYDADGKTDFTVFRPSNGYWYIYRSSDDQVRADAFGLNGDIPLNGDFNGDGRSDLAVFRPSDGTWYIARPTDLPGQNFDAIQFGLPTDIPAPGDFDGDGKTDVSVFRPSDGNWYLLDSSNGAVTAFHFGINGDRPTQAAFQH